MWAAFLLSLFLWLKPELYNLTTLVIASRKRSLLSRTYSLVMGTNVQGKITNRRRQDIKYDQNVVQMIRAMAYSTLDLHLLIWAGANPPWLLASPAGLQSKTDEVVYGCKHSANHNSIIQKKKWEALQNHKMHEHNMLLSTLKGG